MILTFHLSISMNQPHHWFYFCLKLLHELLDSSKLWICIFSNVSIWSLCSSIFYALWCELILNGIDSYLTLEIISRFSIIITISKTLQNTPLSYITWNIWWFSIFYRIISQNSEDCSGHFSYNIYIIYVLLRWWNISIRHS